MARDPYGYEDTAPPASAEGDASQAMWFGVTAAMLGSVGVCFCYLPYVVALPMGAYAAWKGYRAVSAAVPPHPKDRAMATAGLVSGTISALVSGMFVVFLLMYVVLVVAYMAMLFLVLGAGIAEGM